MLRRKQIMEFPSRAWEGLQGNKLISPGYAWIQGEFVPGPWHVQLVAKGVESAGEWPVMELLVNGEKVGSQTVDSKENKRYAFSFTTRRGPNRLTIRFANDNKRGPGDRQLILGPGFLLPSYPAKAGKEKEEKPKSDQDASP